ncbi:glycosyltransferase family 2 protein [Rhizobium alvei]|uniref:Glycosyltransferase family 2 protein n=1 Tax=Rhizobium alvei TaxID=1132659 RepID=A0ABT8YLJ9_9HYPH|nr:glycosyltransferase family 2 protein [Rhizobium alvei]MDO6964533.1 glycosyltransferase family 2 protein [Rhizobium alvei]
MTIGEYEGADLPRQAMARPNPAAPGLRILPQIGLSDDETSEIAVLRELGFSKPFIALLLQRARAHGTTLEAELIVHGSVDEEAYYGALAKALGLAFVERIEPQQVHVNASLDSQLKAPHCLRLNPSDRAPLLAIVPTALNLENERRRLAKMPTLAKRIVVTTPTAIRSVVWQIGSARRVNEAVNQLFDSRPDLSARIVFQGNQGFWAGSLLVALIAFGWMAPEPTMLVMHLFLSASYLFLLAIRWLAVSKGARLTRPRPLAEIENYPVYTVMAALYREKEVVPQLIDRLQRLNWPRSRLDIKLVCEADDADTIGALEALDLGKEFEIVRVPPMQPRTKPKALNYALAGARGEFLVLYDAEDRPHPDQLREACQRFRNRPETVVCLQAPLIISNGGTNWIAGLFSIEYSGLFRRLLPLLASANHPLPLGGTSNHFRTDALRSIGGWDPYNVTEDADLGLRLRRLGYATEVISRPTYEDAPTEIGIWFGQRGRWFKGWMQTWLVHMRDPRRLVDELGASGMLMFHMMITGMLVSALVHPLLIGFMVWFSWCLLAANTLNGLQWFLFALDWINVIGAFLLFAMLGYNAMYRLERKRLGRSWLFIPLYWLMISAAAWHAAIELKRRPFFWKKTPHRPSGQGG